MKTNEHYGIGINTAKGAVVLFFGAICFATGYYSGWRDRAVKLKPQAVQREAAQSSKKTSSNEHIPQQPPSVRPLNAIPLTPLPPNHPPVPESDEHGHPSFDCSALQAELPQPSGSLSISQLFSSRAKREGEHITLNAIVVGAFYKILGTNWYHLCDAPSGQVLVVSSDQLVEQRTAIKVSGQLSVDYDLSGVYRFPLYIKEAKLSGDGVQPKPEDTPKGVIKL